MGMSAEQRSRISVATKREWPIQRCANASATEWRSLRRRMGDVRPFLKAMRAVWALAPVAAQRRFLAEIFSKDGEVKSP
jgi:hypothetical protein